MEYKRNAAMPWVTFAAALMYSISYVVLIVTLKDDLDRMVSIVSLFATGAFALVTIILALITSKINKVCDPLFERAEAVSARYTVLAIIVTVFPLILEVLMYAVIPDAEELAEEYPARISLIITILTIYVTGTPLLLLTLRKVPKMKIEKRNPTISFFFLCLMTMCGLCLVGTLIGLPIELVLTKPFESGDEISQSNIAEIISSTTLLERVLVIGIIGPVFEELIFRKLLIERTIRYGETFSIILSGFMFGLFHGNFQQFFFATLIGMLFAFLFIRTGKIIYPILLHCTVNLTTSIVTASMYIKLLPYWDVIDDFEELPTDIQLVAIALVLWMMFLGMIAVTGLILYCVFYKKFKPYKAPDEPATGMIISKCVHSPLFWSFVVVCLGDFGTAYLPDIVKTIIG